MNQSDRARRFLELHTAPELLVLANAWDIGSAKVIAACGAPAIGTTSMGIAASLGFPDVQVLPFEAMLTAVRTIVDAVELPVTADFEAGYADTPDGIADNVDRLVATGAIGINIEDSTGRAEQPLLDPDAFAERLQAIRERAAIPLVINARTDVFFAPEPTLDAAIARGNRYLKAGADCIFVPGGLDAAAIARLVAEVDGPVNVLANPTVAPPLPPPPAELERIGVARLSVGSAPMKATLALTQRIARGLLHEHSYDALQEELAAPAAAAAYDAATR